MSVVVYSCCHGNNCQQPVRWMSNICQGALCVGPSLEVQVVKELTAEERVLLVGVGPPGGAAGGGGPPGGSSWWWGWWSRAADSCVCAG